MLTIRPRDARGHADHGWLDARHTFSFADYRDPAHMGFSLLRVINEDRVRAGQGFGKHPHRDMEIVTYVLEGSLAHKDSMGNEEFLRAGEVQRMSAGSGITHSEYNASDKESVHLLQIWLLPDAPGIEPSYEQKAFPPATRRGQLTPVVTTDGRDGSLRIHTDANVFLANLADGDAVAHAVPAGRRAWVQVTRGSVRVDDEVLLAGDGVAVADAAAVRISTAAGEAGEALVFDLP